MKETRPNDLITQRAKAFLAQRDHIVSLQGQVADLQQQRAEMVQLIDMLMGEKKQLHADLDEQKRKIQALEHELTGGGLVSELFTGARRRLGL